MLRELSDHVLDIAQNSVVAGASLVEISVDVNAAADTLTIRFADDGCGMSPELLANVTDPFTTSRTTRKVGLGLPMLKQAAIMTGGSVEIKSERGSGTTVTAVFGLSHIDRPPMGDLAGTLFQLAVFSGDIDFFYILTSNGESVEFDTREIRQAIAPLPIDSPDIALWVRENITETIKTLFGGAHNL